MDEEERHGYERTVLTVLELLLKEIQEVRTELVRRADWTGSTMSTLDSRERLQRAEDFINGLRFKKRFTP
jgi:hypothetical protein